MSLSTNYELHDRRMMTLPTWQSRCRKGMFNDNGNQLMRLSVHLGVEISCRGRPVVIPLFFFSSFFFSLLFFSSSSSPFALLLCYSLLFSSVLFFLFSAFLMWLSVHTFSPCPLFCLLSSQQFVGRKGYAIRWHIMDSQYK